MDGMFDDLIPPAPPLATGAQPTPGQAAYFAATGRDVAAPTGTATNPTYDTADRPGVPDAYHVTPEGSLHDPHPQVNLGFDDLIPRKPTSQALGFGEGVNTVAKNFAGMLDRPGPLAFMPAGDPRGVAMDALSQPVKALLSRFQGPLDQMEKTYRPGLKGKIGGEVLASIPLAAEGGPLVTGALQGFLTSDAKDPIDKAVSTVEGAIGGKIGDKVFGAIGQVAAPKVRQAAQWAAEHGIRLPPGAVLGGLPHVFEKGAAKGTIAGPMIGAAQRQGIEDFNLATSRNALADAGLTLPEGTEAGHAAINATRQALSNGYQAVTPHLSLVRDAPLHEAVTKAMAVANTLPGAHKAQIASIVGQIPAKGGQLSGDAVSDLSTHLRQEVADASGDPDMFTKKYGRAVSDLSSAVEDALERSNPEYAPKLQGLRSGWAKLVRIQRAGRDAVQDGGVYTPKGLLTAARSMDQTSGDNATARGEALLQDWANQGKEVLPDKLPTAGNIWSHLPELAVMYGVGQEAHAPGIIGLGAGEAALAGLYSKPLRGPINAALTQRPQMVRDLVARLQGARGVASDAAAIAAPKLLPAPQVVSGAQSLAASLLPRMQSAPAPN